MNTNSTFLQLLSLGYLPSFGVTVGLFTLVFCLEVLTPPEYVMGYLYITPILLINPRLDQKMTFLLTSIAVILTLANLWVPGNQIISASVISNRCITSLSLVVTGLLCNHQRYMQQAFSQQQIKLQTQEKLVSLREDFTSTLAHDLKTPLLGAIETLKAFYKQQFGVIEPQQKTVLETMIRSHQTSLKLVETLLDIYRNDTEGVPLHRTLVNLSQLAEFTATDLLDLAASRRVHLSLQYRNSDFRQFLWVDGDPLQLQRVFTNLLINAIHHSPRGARVEVVLDGQSTYQVVQVIDAGAGIQPDELPHLFERFYQGQSDRQTSGSGLGLYLARQIIEAHDGTIWAENRSPHGAIFGFRLPAVTDSSSIMP